MDIPEPVGGTSGTQVEASGHDLVPIATTYAQTIGTLSASKAKGPEMLLRATEAYLNENSKFIADTNSRAERSERLVSQLQEQLTKALVENAELRTALGASRYTESLLKFIGMVSAAVVGVSIDLLKSNETQGLGLILCVSGGFGVLISCMSFFRRTGP